MGENFAFGGGVSQTNMVPAVMVMSLIAALLVLILPRKYAIAPILVIVFLTPRQQIYFGGFHFFVMRIMILAGGLRMLATKLFSPDPLFKGGLRSFDKLFCVWAFLSGLAYILLYREAGAVTSQVALWMDAYGGYFLFRYLIQDKEDVVRTSKTFVVVASVLAVCMLYEYTTAFNVFSYISVHQIIPWDREGKIRAQSVFGNSITAGTFGATLLPLFFWLWKSGKSRLLGLCGLVASSVVALTSVASTPVTAWMAGILALCLWPIRKQMRPVRWGIVLTVLGLAMVMKAPVWFIIARVDFVGGHGWDRAALIDQFMHHFSDWWLIGAKDNAGWGADTWDACNEFVAEGLGGGLVTFLLFIYMLGRSFSMIGQARKQVEGTLEEWFFWCLGGALFTHVVAFWGIDYFDQTRVLLYAFLAMVTAATAVGMVPEIVPQPVLTKPRWAVPRPATAGVASKSLLYSPARSQRASR